MATMESSSDLSRRLFLRLELPAVLHKVTLRQLHLLPDCCSHIFDHATQIAVGDVGLNDDATLHVFAIDRVRTLIDPNFCDLRDGYFGTSRRIDECVADRFD